MSILKSTPRLLALALLASTFALQQLAGAQALCALRDPSRQITALFPKADGYRSIVRTVGQSAREAVKQSLPFTLHFNELGRHTLYVVQGQGEPLGLVHVRSEAGEWGLVEIAWAFDFDLNVIGFEFQRCRDRSKNLINTKHTRLEGLGFAGLRGMLNKDCSSLSPTQMAFPPSAQSLGVTVVRNGLKTIAVTQLAWSDDLAALRARIFARRYLPATRDAAPLTGLYGHKSLALIGSRVGEEGVGISRKAARAFSVSDKNGAPLGRFLTTPWTFDARTVDIQWLFDRHGNIVAIEPRIEWPSAEIASSFQELVGLNPLESDHCSGTAGLIAQEVALAQGSGVRPLHD